MRPRAGPGLRQAHRGGRPRRSAARSEGDRGIPGNGCRMSLLEIRGLEVRYGGIRAVKGIDLEVGAGGMGCVIGANGGGKTSALRAISGLVPTAPGAGRFDGGGFARISPFPRPRAGALLV